MTPTTVVLGGTGGLARLLAPIDVDAFLADHWGGRPLHVRGPRDRFADLFGWAALQELLESGGLPPEYVVLVDEGRVPVDEAAFVDEVLKCRVGRPARLVASGRLRRLFDASGSLVVKYIDRRVPSIQRLVDRLGAELGEPVTGNLYCSSAGCSAIPPHVDRHEVLVLGLEGEKAWTLWPGGDEGVPVEVRVSPGDLLYVPMGCRHVARAVDGRSMHLTLGVHRRTGEDLLRWLLRECTRNPSVRRNLPLGWPSVEPTASADDALSAGVEDARTALCALVDAPGTIAAFLHDLVRAEGVRAAPPWPHGWPGRDRLEPGSRLRCAGAHRAVLRPGDEGAVSLAVAGHEYAVAIEVAPAIEWLFRTRRASVAAIAARAPDVPVELVAEVLTVLLGDGVIALDARDREREDEP